MVSVLVSIADSLPPKLKLHTQLDLEARVGIERVRLPQATRNQSSMASLTV
jgi:hypothetical protein